MNEAYVDLRRIVKSYDGRINAVHGIDLGINKCDPRSRRYVGERRKRTVSIPITSRCVRNCGEVR